MGFTVIARYDDTAAQVGALTRWTDVHQVYQVRLDRDTVIRDNQTNAEQHLPAGAIVGRYEWRNGVGGVDIIPFEGLEMVPHFCTQGGVRLAQELAQKWRHLNIIDEANYTGLRDGLIEGSSIAVATSLVATLGTGAVIGTTGFITGFTAGFGQGVLVALKQAAIGGVTGFYTGAVKGFMCGGVYALTIGCVTGTIVGIGSANLQYDSLTQTQKMDNLLVESIEVFSKFAGGEIGYNRTRELVAIIIHKANELFPDEASRQNVPVYRACFEEQYIIGDYGRRQRWE